MVRHFGVGKIEARELRNGEECVSACASDAPGSGIERVRCMVAG
jgi:hypothetical protein